MYKFVMQEGQKCRYNKDDSFNLKMQCFVALAFLPVNDVADVYEQLTNNDNIPQ